MTKYNYIIGKIPHDCSKIDLYAGKNTWTKHKNHAFIFSNRMEAFKYGKSLSKLDTKCTFVLMTIKATRKLNYVKTIW